MANGIIKQVKIAGTNDPYDISALYIQDGNGTNKTWSDITALVQAGFTIEAPWTSTDYASTTAPTATKLATVPAITVYYNNGASTATGTLGASEAETKKHIYLIYHPAHNPSTSDTYDEYVSTGSGTSAAWEKVGNTDVDLSGYATKAVAGKAGTYNTTEKASFNTGWNSTSTPNTTNNGAQTATGTATITVPKASLPTATGSGGDSEEDNTGSAGGFTINGSSFSFTGTAASPTLKLDHHSYTPEGSIGGSQTVNAHSHTVNAATASITYVTGATTSTAGAHSHTVDSHTHAAAQTVLTGVKATSTATVVTGVSTVSISVSSNVLNLPSIVATGASGTTSAVTGVGANGTVSVAGAASAATLTSSEVAAHSHTVNVSKSTATFMTGATLGTAGGVTINGSNFSFTGSAATLKHTQTATATTAYNTITLNSYTPAGSIGGSQTVAAHSHTYNKPKNHTHSITFSSITVTGTAAVAVSSHSHSVTIASHSHSVAAHSHSVTIPNCNS